MGWFIVGLLIGIAVGYFAGRAHGSSQLEALDNQIKQADKDLKEK